MRITNKMALVTMIATSLAGSLSMMACIPVEPNDASPEIDNVSLSEAALSTDPQQLFIPLFHKGSAATPDGSLHTWLEFLIAGSPPGSEIRISAYNWSRYWNAGPDSTGRWPDDKTRGRAYWPVLKDAMGRGVKVTVVIREEGADKEEEEVTDWLKDNGAAVKICKRKRYNSETKKWEDGGSCLEKYNLHAKFFLFSKTWGYPDVMLSTSANMDYHQLRKWNDSMLITKDRKAYAATVKYFQHMFDATETSVWKGLDSDKIYTVTGEIQTTASDRAGVSGGLRMYYFPRPYPTQLNILKNIGCHRGGYVRIMMSHWTDGESYGLEIAKQLVKLADSSCGITVYILTRSSISPEVLDVLEAPNSNVWVGKVKSSTNIHNKFMLINARYAGKWRQLVFTGSANFTTAAGAWNDELLLRIEGDQVFALYDQYWWDGLSRL
ncbi:MAG: hypothetical protein GY847_09875 [Proteobacteria bacterium]|nr:hypothetical protein [Pseudomonadota bacterium]